MAPQRRPIGSWQKTAHLTDANWDESRFQTDPQTGVITYWGEPANGPWIGFNRVPTTSGQKVNVEVLLNYSTPPRLVGIRLNVPLTVEMFKSLPLDAIRRAATQARPHLWEHSEEAGDILPEELAPDVVLSDYKSNTPEHLALVFQVWEAARGQDRNGYEAVIKASHSSPSRRCSLATAERWVSAARKMYDPSLKGAGPKKKGTTSR
jgi:hypothetical protein